MAKTTKNPDLVITFLRAGLAVVFLYAAVSSLRQPLEWAGFLPHFLLNHASGTLLFKIFAVYELVLVAWLIWGHYRRYAGLLCALTLAGIVVFNTSQLITTFRDVGLAFMGLALYFSGD